jgi:hypothetical protein
MHRQTPVAFGVLAACAVIASGAVLLREQILSFSSWPEAGGGGSAPEIAIPQVRSLAAGARGSVRPGAGATRVRIDAARVGLPGVSGAFTVLTPRPADAGSGTDGGPGGKAAPGGRGTAGGQQQLTVTGSTGSGHPDTGPINAPLSAYGDGIPLAGEAGTAGSGVAPTASAAVPLEPAAAVRVAAPQAADVAPEADVAPVSSSADNAPPPSDPAESVPEPTPPPAPEPTPDPAPPAADPAPVPAEPEPAPEVPPAPADPTPPADPVPMSDPTPAPPEDPAVVQAPAPAV